MSLYDDIDVDTPSEGEKGAGQVLGGIDLTFLKDQLKAKKASLQNAQKSLSATIPPPSPSTSSPGQSRPATSTAGSQVPSTPAFTPSTIINRPRFSATPSRPAGAPAINLKPRKAIPLPVDTTATFSIVPQALKEDKIFLFGEIEIRDEYNPLVPTDYSVYKPKREAQLAKERAAKEVAERIAKEHVEEERKRKAGAAIAPPPTLAEHGPRQPAAPPPPPQVYEPPAKFGKAGSRGLGVAQAIMSRMGYQEGRGLGRDEQGISSALRMEKTGGKAGRIVGEDVAERTAPIAPAHSITELLKSASKIVVLKNMVTANDVDVELEAEIKEEMTKYGQLASVVIHKMQNPASEEDTVRIFLEFTNIAQAIKAVVDMNQRFFGGRAIRATFYTPDEFAQNRYEI